MADVSNKSLQGLIESTGNAVLALGSADVGLAREALRRARWRRLLDWTALLTAAVVLRLLVKGDHTFLPLPHIDPFLVTMIVFFGLLLAMIAAQSLWTGKSPHVMYRAEQIDNRLGNRITPSRGQDRTTCEHRHGIG